MGQPSARHGVVGDVDVAAVVVDGGDNCALTNDEREKKGRKGSAARDCWRTRSRDTGKTWSTARTRVGGE